MKYNAGGLQGKLRVTTRAVSRRCQDQGGRPIEGYLVPQCHRILFSFARASDCDPCPPARSRRLWADLLRSSVGVSARPTAGGVYHVAIADFVLHMTPPPRLHRPLYPYRAPHMRAWCLGGGGDGWLPFHRGGHH